MKNGHISKKGPQRISPKTTHSEGRKTVVSLIPQRNTSLLTQSYFQATIVQLSSRVNGHLPRSKHIGAAMNLQYYSLQFNISFHLWELITIKSRPASELPSREDGCYYFFCGQVTEKGKTNTPTSTTNQVKLIKVTCATVTLEL